MNASSGLPGVFIHERAVLETDKVGAKTRIWAFAHVLPGARIGEGCNICDHVFIENDVTIGDRVTLKNGVMVFDGVTIHDEVFVGPGAVFTNDRTPRVSVPRQPPILLPTVVERGATIGANATILSDITIGARAFAAAGAVVTGDVPPHGLVAGNPARRMGWVCSCGRRLPESLLCQCGEAFRLAGEERGLAPVPS